MRLTENYLEITFFVSLCTTFTVGLKNVELIIKPSVVQRGKSSTLYCTYDLEGEPLYVVKWYRGQREFYRYSPNEIPNIKYFLFDGLSIDGKLSSEKEVHLKNIGPQMNGDFSCEVSTDSPYFHTKSDHREMLVIDHVDLPPTLLTSKQFYYEGDVVKASCTSSPSKPAATISILLNNLVVCDNCTSNIYRSEGLWISRTDITLQLTKSDFYPDKVLLRCITRIKNRYQRETEVRLDNRVDPVPQKVTASASVCQRKSSFLLLSATFHLVYLCISKIK